MKNKKTLIGKKIVIAIVDDHVQTAISLSQILEHEGFKTLQAYNGRDAIDLCKKEKPDLLILDIRMEGMSGFEVARALPEQKILFMTGFDDITDAETAQYKNVVGLMRKPIDNQELVRVVKEKLKLSVK